MQNLFVQLADGTGRVDRLTTTTSGQIPLSFTPDGTSLVIRETSDASNSDLNVLSMPGGRVRTPLINSTFTKPNAEISPDGHWMAYQSNESGQDEVHVRPYPNVENGHWQISTGGGTRPLWARDGRELFYVDPTGHIASVPVRILPTFAAGSPTIIAQMPSLSTSGVRNYDVSLDGRRFLVITNAARKDLLAAPLQLNVVLNWNEELKRLVTTKH